MKMTIRMGTSVIANKDEKPTARVFVHASGRNMRPSCASNRKTGRNETTIIRREKNSAGPTCLAESMRILTRSRSAAFFADLPALVSVSLSRTGPFEESISPSASPPDVGRSDRCRYPFSTMTMAASTKTPIANANPPSDMMLELTFR